MSITWTSANKSLIGAMHRKESQRCRKRRNCRNKMGILCALNRVVVVEMCNELKARTKRGFEE
jgi:hypothetical protein